MKTTAIILAFIALASCAVAQDSFMLSINTKRHAALVVVVEEHNAKAKVAHDTAEAAKVEASKTYVAVPFVPITPRAYLMERIAGVLDSYDSQVTNAAVEILAQRLKAATQAKRDAAKAAMENALK